MWMMNVYMVAALAGIPAIPFPTELLCNKFRVELLKNPEVRMVVCTPLAVN